jgi:hypothetical protein
MNGTISATLLFLHQIAQGVFLTAPLEGAFLTSNLTASCTESEAHPIARFADFAAASPGLRAWVGAKRRAVR